MKMANDTFQIGGASTIRIGAAVELIAELLPRDGRVVAVTDAEVARCHPELLAGRTTLAVAGGEEGKVPAEVARLWGGLLEAGADRSSFVLGVGGGVVTDMAGFAAATYMRGIPFGFVATTLLAQVDAAVGGKNGVNVGGYKNMAGTFAQPRFVICDPALTTTLPDREFRAGLAEALKAGIVGDGALFAAIEAADFAALRSDMGLLGRVVAGAVGVKAAIVNRDEREAGERRKLNLGHTLAHAIEKCSGEMNHGEAVAVGTWVVARMARRMGLMGGAECARIGRLLGRLGFRLTPPAGVEQLLEAVGADKKRAGGVLHVVLPEAVGRCVVRQMPIEAFRQLAREVLLEDGAAGGA